MLFSLLLLGLSTMAQETPNADQAFQTDPDPIFKYADTYAIPIGCEKKKDIYKQQECTNAELEAFFNKNRTPLEGDGQSSQREIVTARWVVEKDGTISNASILYQTSKTSAKELLRLIGLMPPMRPAMLKREPVRSYFWLTAEFEPNGKIELEDELFKVIDTPSVFTGCGDIIDPAERQDCSHEKLTAFVKGKLQYPEEAKENGVEGMCVLAIVIERDGSISFPRVVRDIGAGLGHEALRVVGEMPDWVPGTQRGQPVRFQVNLPFKFSLADEKMKKKMKKKKRKQ